jgi:hypothetical protein
MTQEIAPEDYREEDGQPVIKRDLRLLKVELGRRFDELRDHFDATVEIIKDELRGANSDELSLLDDTTKDHEERLTTIEHKIGLR